MTHNCLYIAKFLSYYGFPFYICLLLQKTLKHKGYMSYKLCTYALANLWWRAAGEGEVLFWNASFWHSWLSHTTRFKAQCLKPRFEVLGKAFASCQHKGRLGQEDCWTDLGREDLSAALPAAEGHWESPGSLRRGFIGVPLMGRGFIGVPLRLSSCWALGFALQAPTPNRCLCRGSLRTCGSQRCFQARSQPALCSPRGHDKLGKKNPQLPENNLQPLSHARPLPYKPALIAAALTAPTRVTTPWRGTRDDGGREGGEEEEETALASRGPHKGRSRKRRGRKAEGRCQPCRGAAGCASCWRAEPSWPCWRSWSAGCGPMATSRCCGPSGGGRSQVKTAPRERLPARSGRRPWGRLRGAEGWRRLRRSVRGRGDGGVWGRGGTEAAGLEAPQLGRSDHSCPRGSLKNNPKSSVFSPRQGVAILACAAAARCKAAAKRRVE